MHGRDFFKRAWQRLFWPIVPALLVAVPALAQIPPLSVTNPVPQGSPIPRILPSVPPAVGPGIDLTHPTGPDGSVPDVAVEVRSVVIEGATAYPPARLGALTAGLTGPVKLARIEEVRRAILALYREDGYVLSVVSAAISAEGALRFIVTEGHIASVKLDGDIGPAGTQVLRFLHHLTETRPIDTATMERWLLLAQDVPGITLRAVLRPTAGEPGALELVAQVSRAPITGLLTADNRAYKLTGPEQGLAVVDFNSFTEFGERTELSLYGANGATQLFGQAALESFIGDSGLKIRLYGGTGNANPYGELSAIGYSGITTIAGAVVTYPLIRTRAQSLNLVGSFDILDSTIDTNTGPGFTRRPTSVDNLRVLRAGADYALQDTLLGDALPGVNSATLRLSQGVDLFGASQKGGPLAAQLGENPQFFKAAGEISRSQTLFSPWEGGSVSLFTLLAWQWSEDVLPPSEKLFLGGNRIGRGFYAGEVTGDKGLTTSVELRLDTEVNLAGIGIPFTLKPQFYVFYDWGEAWQNAPTEPQGRLSSAGGGVRLGLTSHLELDFEGVSRFTLTPQGGGANVTRLSSDAFYWAVIARF